MKARRHVILDRDGTIIVERNYLADPSGVELLPGAAPGLRAMREQGLGLVVVTNQSGVGRGYFDDSTVQAVHARMQQLLEQQGVHLDGLYYCPHRPDQGCACRKPAVGLVARAAADLGFDPREVFVVGDKACDVELGLALGARTILVRTGYGEETAQGPGPRADALADDLLGAARIIAGFLGTQGGSR